MNQRDDDKLVSEVANILSCDKEQTRVLLEILANNTPRFSEEDIEKIAEAFSNKLAERVNDSQGKSKSLLKELTKEILIEMAAHSLYGLLASITLYLSTHLGSVEKTSGVEAAKKRRNIEITLTKNVDHRFYGEIERRSDHLYNYVSHHWLREIRENTLRDPRFNEYCKMYTYTPGYSDPSRFSKFEAMRLVDGIVELVLNRAHAGDTKWLPGGWD